MTVVAVAVAHAKSLLAVRATIPCYKPLFPAPDCYSYLSDCGVYRGDKEVVDSAPIQQQTNRISTPAKQTQPRPLTTL